MGERASSLASDTRHRSTVFWQETSTMHCYMKGDKGTAHRYTQYNVLFLLNQQSLEELLIQGEAAYIHRSDLNILILSKVPCGVYAVFS